ncbi:MAG: phosphoribosylformylglycinamidine synthase I [Bdellovibrionaceae bacterium]|nr:phosphoribosylformylglycinamidine synthase I [Pseudobdellovibrionaceae bacterium]|tara:strand:- start:1412 stop:2056 length:645 start_codon:yes stop_codon:yes gene_type:complete
MKNQPKIGVLRFLGTNCDQDIWEACLATNLQPEWVWYQDHFEPSNFDAFIVPGGFSYGDYLRSGALAAKAPSMKDLRMAADKGIPIVGICNGFQILCEMNLLPGVLMKNRDGKFIDEWVDLEVCSESPYSSAKKVRYPIAHGDGRYFVTNEELKNLQDQDQVWLRYFDNPNGSTFDIAGVKTKNVFGLMPHPERALFDWMGGSDGQSFFEGFLK